MPGKAMIVLLKSEEEFHCGEISLNLTIYAKTFQFPSKLSRTSTYS